MLSRGRLDGLIEDGGGSGCAAMMLGEIIFSARQSMAEHHVRSMLCGQLS